MRSTVEALQEETLETMDQHDSQLRGMICLLQGFGVPMNTLQELKCDPRKGF